MNQNDKERFYFNQNIIYYKDKTYNSGGSFEVSICSSTTDYKTFSAPTLHISVVGENNLRRLCSLNYPDVVDLFTSTKDVISNIETIYSTERSNVITKKYQFDRSLKFEFVNIQNMGDRVVVISVIHSSSDFTKVIIPYYVFCSFVIGILKYYVNEYINISFSFSTRNLLTELLEQNKIIKNGIITLPSAIIENNNIKNQNEVININNDNIPIMEETIDDFNKFLGKDMENIKIPDLDSKYILEEKTKKLEVNSLLVTKTLSKDLQVLESMLNSAATRPDPMVSLFEGFRRSMNLDSSFNFLPGINEKDLKSFLYISKINHDIFLNLYLNKNTPIPSSYTILKYQPVDNEMIHDLNGEISNDLLLIFGFIKIFRSKMESRESDADKNGSIFYLRLRSFLDPLVYSFINQNKKEIIQTNICTNFEKYKEIGFFNHYQNILTENNFEQITINDIKDFCNELNEKVLSRGILTNIDKKHDDLFNSGFLKISSNNNLSVEQIINEYIPLEVLEKIGVNIHEISEEELNKIVDSYSISDYILKLFMDNKKVKKKECITNITKTVKFFNNEIPESYRDKFFQYIEDLKLENFDFINTEYSIDELGENIIKALYVWNESEDKKEPLTTFRSKLEECLLTKELILIKYKTKTEIDEVKPNEEKWDLDFSL